MNEASIPEGLADNIYEPLFLDEEPDDTMVTTVTTFTGEDTLATIVLPSSQSKSSNKQADSNKRSTGAGDDDCILHYVRDRVDSEEVRYKSYF